MTQVVSTMEFLGQSCLMSSNLLSDVGEYATGNLRLRDSMSMTLANPFIKLKFR